MAQDAAEELTAALAAGHELDVGGREVPVGALADVLTAPPRRARRCCGCARRG